MTPITIHKYLTLPALLGALALGGAAFASEGNQAAGSPDIETAQSSAAEEHGDEQRAGDEKTSVGSRADEAQRAGKSRGKAKALDSAAKMEARALRKQAAKTAPGRLFARLDHNRDGVLSELEVAVLPEALREGLDSDADGLVTRQEARQAHRKHMQARRDAARDGRPSEARRARDGGSNAEKAAELAEGQSEGRRPSGMGRKGPAD